ncbi:MAG: MCE family protein [Paludibacteraceae bacterium]|nr:MCE family protein [Paludibacteraceae bacterium]
MKKFFTREVKVALLVTTALIILYFGLNYLKGINLFNPINKYYAKYESVEGLVASSPVYVRGYKVGQVNSITYDFSNEIPFVIEFTTEKSLKLPKGTIAEMFDDGLMGGKAIRLVMSKNDEYISDGDTLSALKVAGLMDFLSGHFLPTLYKTVADVDSTIVNIQQLIASAEIKNSLKSIESVTSDLSITSERLKNLMDGKIPAVVANIDTISLDLKKVSSDLKDFEYAELLLKVDSTMANLCSLSNSLNDKDGSLGLLLRDQSLYNSLDSTVNSANLLLKDLKENPKRYVHFSLFGRKEK